MNQFIKFSFFCTVVVSFFFLGCGAKNANTPNELGQLAFEYFKARDFSSLKTLYVTKEEYAEFLKSHSEQPDSEQIATVAGYEKQLREEFKSMDRADSLLKANKEQLDDTYSKAVFNSADTLRMSDSQMNSYMKGAIVYVVSSIFDVGEKSYMIPLRGCIKTNRGWAFLMKGRVEETQRRYKADEKDLCGGIKLGMYSENAKSPFYIEITPQSGKYLVKIMKSSWSEQFLLACDNGVITGATGNGVESRIRLIRKKGENEIIDSEGNTYTFVR